MHGQQAQAFGQQQAMGQQISSRLPAPYQGLGAQGMGSGFGGGGAYNYGNPASGYGPGNSFGNTMTSMVGGVGKAIGGGMGVAGAIGGGLMGGLGGAMMGFNVGGMIGGGIKHVASSMMEGAHEQASLEKTLSQFQFQNAGSRTGKGFGRQDSMQIGNMVRQMERMPEMLTSFGELNKLMDKMGQMGLMQGVKDASEFMRKFRDTTSTLKDMAKMMGSTMEGALQAFGEARQSGFYNKQDITRNVIQRQMVSSVTGMSQQQVGALQMYGAEMSHSLGGSRKSGSRNMMRTAGQLGAANQMGIISNDDIMEMTGKEGAAGLQDMSGMMGQLSYKMGSSNVGQALTLALGQQKDGRYTGEMDQALVEKVRRGELSLSELKSMARSKASTRGAKLSFAAHKNRLRTEMSGAVGSEGMAMQLQEILGNRGWSNPDAQNLVMQRFGASEEQANLLQKMMPNLQNIGTEMGLASKGAMRGNVLNSKMAEGGFDAIKHRISKKLQHYTTDWAKDLGVGVRDYFQNWADEFMDDLSGRYTKEVTKRVSSMATYGGISKMAGSINRTAAAAGGARLDVGASGGLSGTLARGMHALGGTETAGERTDYLLAKHMGGQYLHHSGTGGLTGLAGQGLGVVGGVAGGIAGGMTGGIAGASAGFGAGRRLGNAIGGGDAAARAAAGGNIVLDSTLSGRASFTTQGEINKLREAMSSGSYGSDQKKALEGVLSKDEMKGLTSSFKSIMESGDVAGITDPVERERAIYKKLRESNSAGMSDVDKMLERAGKISKSALGKARQKGGMGEGDIVAAVQAAAGGNYRDQVDHREMAGGLGQMSLASLHQARTELSKKIGKINGSSDMASGIDAMKYLDEGGDMGNVVQQLANSYAAPGMNGFSSMGEFMSGGKIRELLSSDASKWSKEDREALTKAGIDPKKMAAKLSTKEGREEIDKLRKLAASGKLNASEITNYLRMGDAAGAKEVISRFNQRGQELALSMGEKGFNDLMDSTPAGKEVKALLAERAKTMAGTTAENYDSNKYDGKLEKAMEGLTSEQRTAVMAADDSLEATTGYSKQLLGSKGKGGALQGLANKRGNKGKGVQDVLAAAGLGNLGTSGAEGDFRKKIEAMLGDNKSLDKGEIGKIGEEIMNAKSKGLFSKDGKEQASTQVSEAEIAKSLADMSTNAKVTAELLQQIASGKTPGKAAT